MTTTAPTARLTVVAFTGLCLSVLALFAGRAVVHICDVDGRLYQVVARHIIERGQWVDVQYLPSVYPHFREHLPFGLWPTAALFGLLGETATLRLEMLWVVACLAAVFAFARRRFSTWAAAAALLVLSTTEAFVMYAALPRLDGPTALFATLAALPWLSARLTRRGLLASVLCAAAAALVKGPFGVVPLAAVSTARALLTRQVRPWLWGAAAGALAVLPVSVFLLYQKQYGDASWWSGYVQTQLFASAQGLRADGHLEWWYPWYAFGRTFWPGLVLVPLAVWRALSTQAEADAAPHDGLGAVGAMRVAGLAVALGLCALCLPARKIVHHLMVLYPLAVLGVAPAGGELLRRVFSRPAWARAATAVTLAAALMLWGFVASGRPFWVHGRTGCVVYGPLGAKLRELAPGTAVAMVTPRYEWSDIAALAAELKLVAWAQLDWAALTPEGQAAPVALSRTGAGEPPPPWEPVASDDGWTLWRRGPER